MNMKIIYPIIIVLVLLGLSAFFLYKGVKKEEKSMEKNYPLLNNILKEKQIKLQALLKSGNESTPTESPTQSPTQQPVLPPTNAEKEILKEFGKLICNVDTWGEDPPKLNMNQFRNSYSFSGNLDPLNEYAMTRDWKEFLQSIMFIILFSSVGKNLSEDKKIDLLGAAFFALQPDFLSKIDENQVILPEEAYKNPKVKDYFMKDGEKLKLTKVEFARILFRFISDKMTDIDACVSSNYRTNPDESRRELTDEEKLQYKKGCQKDMCERSIIEPQMLCDAIKYVAQPKDIFNYIGKSLCNREFNENTKLRSAYFDEPNKEDVTLLRDNETLILYILTSTNISENDKINFLFNLIMSDDNNNPFKLEGNNVKIHVDIVNKFNEYFNQPVMDISTFKNALYRFMSDISTNNTKCIELTNRIGKDTVEENQNMCSNRNNMINRIKDKNLCDYIVN
jgi:hypothetical protein